MDKVIESAEFSGDRKNIIKTDEGYILKNVVLLSEYSKNPGPSGKPRRYTEATQKEACPHFENLQICVNHPNGGASRDALSVIGKSVNPRVVSVQEGTKKVHKTIGDVHLISCAASDHLVKVGQLDPRLLGMSITGDGKFKEDVDGYDNVDKLKPNTSDFVHRPATTKGLFESIQEDVNLEENVKTEILGKLSERIDEIEESFMPPLPVGITIPEKAQRPASRIQEGQEKIGDGDSRPGQLASQLRGLKTAKAGSKSKVTESQLESTDELDEDELDENEEKEEKEEFRKIVEAENIKTSLRVKEALKEDDDGEAEDEDAGDTDDLPEDVDNDSEEDGDEDATGGEGDDLEAGEDDEVAVDGDGDGDEETEDPDGEGEDGFQSDGEGDGQTVNTNPNGMTPEDAAKQITDTANAATFEANTANSPESHMDACFAHCGACAQLAGIDKDAARAHFMKANEHNEVANNLKDKEAPEMLQPAPETSQESVNESASELEIEITEEVLEEDFKAMGLTSTPVMMKAYSALEESERPEFLKALIAPNESGSRGKLDPKSIKKMSESDKPEGKHTGKIKELFQHTNPISEEQKVESAKKVRTWSEVLSK